MRCEVDIGAARFSSARLGQMLWLPCQGKGPLSHLLSMPLQAIRCNNQAEKRPFFPSSPLACTAAGRVSRDGVVYICVWAPV